MYVANDSWCKTRNDSSVGASLLLRACDCQLPKAFCVTANVAGLVSTVMWFLVLVPQVYRTFRRKSVEGVSAVWAIANFTAALNNAFFIFKVPFELPWYAKISAVYMPVLELIMLLEFWAYTPHSTRKSIIAGGCVALAVTIIVLQSTFDVYNELEWLSVTLWSVETFPQVRRQCSCSVGMLEFWAYTPHSTRKSLVADGCVALAVTIIVLQSTFDVYNELEWLSVTLWSVETFPQVRRQCSCSVGMLKFWAYTPHSTRKSLVADGCVALAVMIVVLQSAFDVYNELEWLSVTLWSVETFPQVRRQCSCSVGMLEFWAYTPHSTRKSLVADGCVALAVMIVVLQSAFDVYNVLEWLSVTLWSVETFPQVRRQCSCSVGMLEFWAYTPHSTRKSLVADGCVALAVMIVVLQSAFDVYNELEWLSVTLWSVETFPLVRRQCSCSVGMLEFWAYTPHSTRKSLVADGCVALAVMIVVLQSAFDVYNELEWLSVTLWSVETFPQVRRQCSCSVGMLEFWAYTPHSTRKSLVADECVALTMMIVVLQSAFDVYNELEWLSVTLWSVETFPQVRRQCSCSVGMLEFWAYTPHSTCKSLVADGCVALAVIIVVLQSAFDVYNELEWLSVTLWSIETFPQVRRQCSCSVGMLEFCAYTPHSTRKSLVADGCVALAVMIVVLQSAFDVYNELEWLSVTLWSVETFPQVRRQCSCSVGMLEFWAYSPNSTCTSLIAGGCVALAMMIVVLQSAFDVYNELEWLSVTLWSVETFPQVRRQCLCSVGMLEFCAYSLNSTCMSLIAGGCVALAMMIVILQSAFDVYNELEWLSVTLWSIETFPQVRRQCSCSVGMLEFWAYMLHSVRKSLVAGNCVALAVTIVILQSAFDVYNELKWLSVSLWSVETFPQIFLNMQRQSTFGLSNGMVSVATLGKTTDFFNAYSLILPVQNVVMAYFSSSTAIFGTLQVLWYWNRRPVSEPSSADAAAAAAEEKPVVDAEKVVSNDGEHRPISNGCQLLRVIGLTWFSVELLAFNVAVVLRTGRWTNPPLPAWLFDVGLPTITYGVIGGLFIFTIVRRRRLQLHDE